ncbi:unnamed protein product [Mytilus coruscus]|uniref:Uncharacterized protein n=1 Tax=Mytilus coruscus TaxID=42192 RepID=A0A6J8EN30_MYTCO|nr:unnamed protein product [Mytilus coruscus]
MAGLEHVVVGLDFDNIDLCMDKVLREYPVNIFPTNLNKRTGKAKKCLYKEIDVNLYEKEAKMVTFYTFLAHIHPWIKTLDLFYYEHMGINEQFDIIWFDVPTTWSDPNNNDLQSDCANDNHDDSLTSLQSIVQQDEHTSTLHTAENPSIVDHFSGIENTITNAIMQVENQQTNDHSKLMTAINSSCETLSTLIKANHRSKDQSEVTSLQKNNI